MGKPELTRAANHAAAVSLIGLIGLCIAWEMWLAPLRPGGSWLVLKTAPLLLPLFGILHGRRYTHQWASMLSLAYFMEGTVRASSEGDRAQLLALLEVILSLIFFAATVLYARLTARNQDAPKEPG
ncbi:MAG: DUF2069 domain-containing protein [Sterolibacteriaceae bacterium MAG5]|nr:DUF2069 domain-containing protein [Candidatus Nitricoxidireducens bremensis]